MVERRSRSLLNRLVSTDLCEGASLEFLGIIVDYCSRDPVALDESLEGWSCLPLAFSRVDKNKSRVVVQVDGKDIVHISFILLVNYPPINRYEFVGCADFVISSR